MAISDELWRMIDAQPGWCWRSKAELIHRTASPPEIKRAVEIGVFGARSLVPLCMAMIHRGGQVFGFDVYAPHRLAKEIDEKNWREMNYSQIYKDARQFLASLGWKHQIIYQDSSAHAALMFADESLDFVHVDGSHRPWDAVEDVVLWTRRLRKGGLLLVDDTHWEELKLAMQVIRTGDLEHVETIKDPEKPQEAQLWRKT